MRSAWPQALLRRKIRFEVSETEFLWLEKRARDAGMNISNYVRAGRGLPKRETRRRPTLEELRQQAEDARKKLQEMGENPELYFPANDHWITDYRRRR